MIYQFRTEKDDELFVIDIVNMRWGKASSILSAASVAAAANQENNLARYVFSHEGNLIAQGAGAYTLEGRTPKDGLSVIGIMAVPYEETLVLYLKANVPIKEDSFTSNPIKHIKYNILQGPTFERLSEGQ